MLLMAVARSSSCLTHGSLDPQESDSKRHLDRFSRFTQYIHVSNTQTHTCDGQGVYISFTVCVCFCVCVFVRLRISVPRIKLAASHFARRFIGVQGRESQIFVNFAPLEAQNRTNWPARGPRPHTCKHYRKDAPT